MFVSLKELKIVTFFVMILFVAGPPQKTQKKAKKSCLDCKASYCESCLRLSHPAREPFSQHQLVEPRRYPKPRDLLCTQHEMKVNIFCQDCRQLGCLLCADDHDSHPGHKILSLDQAAQEFTVSPGAPEQSRGGA